MRMYMLLATALAVFALVAAGCGGYGSGGKTKTTPGGGTTTTSGY